VLGKLGSKHDELLHVSVPGLEPILLTFPGLKKSIKQDKRQPIRDLFVSNGVNTLQKLVDRLNEIRMRDIVYFCIFCSSFRDQVRF